VLTPHIIRDSADLRRIFERKMQERQELMDRESIFRDDHWTSPKDWHRTHGLLADIRQAERQVSERRMEAAAAAPRDATVQIAQPPLDLPVPQNAGVTPKPPAATGASTPAKPTIIER